jgi:hypothetical protein
MPKALSSFFVFTTTTRHRQYYVALVMVSLSAVFVSCCSTWMDACMHVTP